MSGNFSPTRNHPLATGRDLSLMLRAGISGNGGNHDIYSADDMSAARMGTLLKRVIATPFGRSLLEDFERRDPLGFDNLKINFDAQVEPRIVGCCYVKTKHVLLNPRYSDALLVSALVHELRHATQPTVAFPPSSPAAAERMMMSRRAREGDAFTCQLAFTLGNMKQAPELHEAFMQYFRDRATSATLAEVEVGCEAYEMARDDKDRARCLSALYWTLQEKYLPEYDTLAIPDIDAARKFGQREDPAMEKYSALQVGAFMIREMQKLPLPGFTGSTIAGDASLAAARIRRNFSRPFEEKISEMTRQAPTPSAPRF